jgi:hypothetical protein
MHSQLNKQQENADGLLEKMFNYSLINKYLFKSVFSAIWIRIDPNSSEAVSQKNLNSSAKSSFFSRYSGK